MESSNEYCQRFREDGYVVWPELLDPASDLSPVIEEYAAATDRLLSQLNPDGENHLVHNGASLDEKLVLGSRGGVCFDGAVDERPVWIVL